MEVIGRHEGWMSIVMGNEKTKDTESVNFVYILFYITIFLIFLFF